MTFTTFLTILVSLVTLKCVAAFASSSLVGRQLETTLRQRIIFRNGTAEDELAIALVMAKELMNPFGIKHTNNLLIAEDTETGQRIGWAQIRSMGYIGFESSSSDSSRFADEDELPSSLNTESRISIEQDVDEYMWQELEEDSREFPNGFSSLPWTKEYKEASQAADERYKRREAMFQKELESRPQFWELSSVYVAPEWRHKGIGTELVCGVLKRHKLSRTRQRNNQVAEDVYALTLARTVPWYCQFGFVQEENIPKPMAFEVAAGKVITSIIGEDLVCIRVKSSLNI